MGDFYARKDPLSTYQPISAIFAPLRAGTNKAIPTGLFSNVSGVSTDLSDIYDAAVVDTDIIRFRTGLKSKGFTNNIDYTRNPDLQLVFRDISISPTPTPSTGVTPTPTQTTTPTVTPTASITPSPTKPPGATASNTPTQTPTRSGTSVSVSGSIAISVYSEGLRRGPGTIAPIQITASYNTNVFKVIVEQRSGANSPSEGTWQTITTDTTGGNTVSFGTSFTASFIGYYQFRATAFDNANNQIGQAVSGIVRVIPNDVSIILTASVVGTTITLTSNASSNFSLIEHVIQQLNSATGSWSTLQTGTSNSLQAVLTSVATGSYTFRSFATASQLKESGMYQYYIAGASVGTSVTLTTSVSPAGAGTITVNPTTVTDTSSHVIAAAPTPGGIYDFSHFLVDGVNVTGAAGNPAGGNTTVAMNNQSHTVVAVFKLKNVAFAIIPNPSGGGSAGANAVSPVPINTIVNLSNTPATNYNFKNYTVNGSPVGSSYQLTSNTTIYANFQLNAGVFIRQVCLNNGVAPYTLRQYFADGTGGETFTDTNNSPTCGYIAPPVAGTLLSTYCSGDANGNPAVPGVNKWGNYADGSGGQTQALIQNNSAECGYQPPPAAGTVLRVTCAGSPGDAYYVRADGSGGETTDATAFSVYPDANAYCIYPDGTVVGTVCIPREASIDQWQLVANGQGSTRVGALIQENSIACGYNPAPNPITPPGSVNDTEA